ncbi:MAG: cyclic nucleotide-binding domain-containing protein [Actinomycetota bacterium]|nr:cyclic nucleotide-binding domain-containing protein [Actinomycetota bacterium]
MRIEVSVTSVSWIPSEAMTGPLRVPVDVGIGHYDDPLPDHIDDLEALRQADRFRFANELRAWIDVEDGRVVDAGYSAGGHIGSTTLALGVGSITIPAVSFPDIQRDPVITATSATFTQTTGGRTGAPLPRRINRPPFLRIVAPTVWTTLTLTIRADGTYDFEVSGASKMPRHFIYDDGLDLVAKSGMIDFKGWTQESFGDNTPWGDTDSPAIVTVVETALERQLSLQIMREGKKPRIRKLTDGQTLVNQGEPGTELFLLLDGILTVEVDGEAIAELGPGSILGERALVEGGDRTSTLRAGTAAKVAVTRTPDIQTEALEELASHHRREDAATAGLDR